MRNITLTLLAIVAAAPAMIDSDPASAQAAKVATIDPSSAMFGAKAIGVAYKAIDTKYDAVLKDVENRERTLQTTTDPLLKALDVNKDGQLDESEQATAVNAKRPEIAQINAAQKTAADYIAPKMEPVTTARIYLFEQMRTRYRTSLENTAKARGVGLVLPSNEAVYALPTTDFTDTVRTEIDKPLAIDPPANWQVTRESYQLYQAFTQALQQQAQAIAQRQAAAAAARPAGTAPAPAPAVTPPPPKPVTR